ncbi:MAG: BatD family protein [Candidatus Omnitrophica bacterium]|nr:BatD family protein [Candidatus Omnitrophota bacterium]
MLKLSSFLLVFAVMLNIAARAEEKTIEAKVSKNTVTTGEIFTYTLKTEGEFTAPKLKLPVFDNFTIVSQSRKERNSKGQAIKLMLEITYGMFAASPGKFTIAGASITDGNKKIETQPIAIEVTGKPMEKKSKIAPPPGRGIDI